MYWETTLNVQIFRYNHKMHEGALVMSLGYDMRIEIGNDSISALPVWPSPNQTG